MKLNQYLVGSHVFAFLGGCVLGLTIESSKQPPEILPLSALERVVIPHPATPIDVLERDLETYAELWSASKSAHVQAILAERLFIDMNTAETSLYLAREAGNDVQKRRLEAYLERGEAFLKRHMPPTSPRNPRTPVTYVF